MNQQLLKSILHYEPITGIFTWATDIYKVNSFTKIRTKGEIAGVFNGGGIIISYKNIGYKAHRLAFLYMTGAMPKDIVDHKDRNPKNNAWSNLRDSDYSNNQANREAKPTSTTGLKGVWEQDGKYISRITCKGKNYYLGLFDDKYKAKAAYDAKAQQLFGEFARS